MHLEFDEVITTHARFRELMNGPSAVTSAKAASKLNEVARRFIAASPFLVLSTVGKDGRLDCSPKGDPAGFVEVLEDGSLIIPDRLGNHRFDSFENILVNPAVGLLFLVPGWNETLRVAGNARIVRDERVQDRHRVNGKAPVLALHVAVTEAFMHCSKAFVRGRLWSPQHWPNLDTVPSLAEWVKSTVDFPEPIETVQGWHDHDRKTRLY